MRLPTFAFGTIAPGTVIFFKYSSPDPQGVRNMAVVGGEFWDYSLPQWHFPIWSKVLSSSFYTLSPSDTVLTTFTGLLGRLLWKAASIYVTCLRTVQDGWPDSGWELNPRRRGYLIMDVLLTWQAWEGGTASEISFLCIVSSRIPQLPFQGRSGSCSPGATTTTYFTISRGDFEVVKC